MKEVTKKSTRKINCRWEPENFTCNIYDLNYYEFRNTKMNFPFALFCFKKPMTCIKEVCGEVFTLTLENAFD